MPTKFLRSGGVAQQRYEKLRQRWVEPDPAVSCCLAWWPWGRRVLHFGLLGLLDEDPSGLGWFGVRTIDRPESLQCVRVHLGTTDGDESIVRAYQLLLQMRPVTTRSATVIGEPR